jgi:hypothetical protein
MNNDSKNSDRKPDLDNVLEEEPQSKHGKKGQAAHHGDQTGPSSDEGGQTVAPQMGDRRGTDREV